VTGGNVEIAKEETEGNLRSCSRSQICESLENVVGGRGVRYMNVHIETVKAVWPRKVEARDVDVLRKLVTTVLERLTWMCLAERLDWDLCPRQMAGKEAETLGSGGSQIMHATVLAGAHGEGSQLVG